MNRKMIGEAIYIRVSDSHEMWKCADQELERQISCFPYVELSDVPRLQQVHKSRRTVEESRTKCLGTYLSLYVCFCYLSSTNLSSHSTKYVIMRVICNVVLCDFEQIVRYETHVLLVLYKQN